LLAYQTVIDAYEGRRVADAREAAFAQIERFLADSGSSQLVGPDLEAWVTDAVGLLRTITEGELKLWEDTRSVPVPLLNRSISLVDVLMPKSSDLANRPARLQYVDRELSVVVRDLCRLLVRMQQGQSATQLFDRHNARLLAIGIDGLDQLDRPNDAATSDSLRVDGAAARSVKACISKYFRALCSENREELSECTGLGAVEVDELISELRRDAAEEGIARLVSVEFPPDFEGAAEFRLVPTPELDVFRLSLHRISVVVDSEAGQRTSRVINKSITLKRQPEGSWLVIPAGNLRQR
jgi:hypothetical protein